MGAYLSEPNLKKESFDDENGQLSYGASSMQGWRLEQEDAHNSILDFDSLTNTSFFAVYDGHGGSEVAQYCAKYLPDYLKTLDEYKKGNLEEALKFLFLKFDESLLSEEAGKLLKDLQESSQAGSVNQDEEELSNGDDTVDEEDSKQTDKIADKEYSNEADALYDEACMPLEEVLKRYSSTEKRVKKCLKNGLKPGMSPMITAAGSSKKKNQTSDINEPAKSTTDFNKQEELDIKEIKKNGNEDDEISGANNHNENDFDEASNLCDLTDSQKSVTSTDTTVLSGTSKLDLNKSTEIEHTSNGNSSNGNNSLPKTPKLKLAKEELKLSPIRKKSLSSSSLSEDLVSTTTTEANVNGIGSSGEENKENVTTPIVESNASNAENGTTENTETKGTSNKKPALTRSNLIAKLLAGCIKEKLKQSKKTKKSEEDEDFVPKEENDAQEGDDDEEEEEEEDEDYDGEDDDDDEEGDEEADDDDEDDDEDDEEEDEEDEEDEDGDYVNQGAGAGCRPGYDSGCTAVVAVLRENKHLYVANAGDSRCVVCREGKAIEMSFDHKPEDDLERERVEKAGGHVTKDGRINNGLNLSRAIGDHSYKANKELPLSEQMITSLPDIQKLDIDPSKDSFMILACDGIWNFMSSQDVCDFIQERLNANYSKLSQICEELFMHCLAPNSEGDGTGCDNMTCIIVTFNPFRKVEVKFNKKTTANISQQEIDNEKNSLKRSIETVDTLANGLNTHPTVLAKKLKQEENVSK